MAAIHWIMLFCIAVGWPIVGAAVLTAADGEGWYRWTSATAASAVGLFVCVTGILANRRNRSALFVTTVVVMAAAQAFFVAGYCDSREGRSEMKPLADAVWDACPDADLYTTAPDRQKRAPSDLSIYLNREVRWTDDAAAIPRGDRPIPAPW